jgi:poly-gamma-glutamate capsule biosynthesis protein CapA/YwtB (metallophosphatase superfamily)
MARRIGFAGDVMLGRNVDEAQRRRPVDAVWGDLRSPLQDLDGFVVNLECCLSDRGRPWSRTRRAFHFRADPDWAIPALETAGVDCCALANNHVLDFEAPALRDTLDHLDAADIAHAGAGRTLDAAFAPARFSFDGLEVAVLSLTDNTPEYAASETEPGTAHVEIDASSAATREAVEGALARATAPDPDLVVASLHWGPNKREAPPEAFQRFAHWLVDTGVDVIHGHSAHIFQGVEVYDGAPICYDTGDFVDDYRVDRTLHNDRSFLFDLTVDEAGRPTRLRLRPTEIEDRRIQWAGDRAAAWSRDRMQTLSEPFDTTFEAVDGDLVLDLEQPA